MREVGVLEAKTHLSSLLAAIEKDGETVTITRHGRAVARLSPANSDGDPPPPRRSGKDLVAEFERLRDRIATEHPETNNLTWEDLKRMARE
jgi:prevent-host-death family protein